MHAATRRVLSQCSQAVRSGRVIFERQYTRAGRFKNKQQQQQQQQPPIGDKKKFTVSEACYEHQSTGSNMLTRAVHSADLLR